MDVFREVIERLSEESRRLLAAGAGAACGSRRLQQLSDALAAFPGLPAALALRMLATEAAGAEDGPPAALALVRLLTALRSVRGGLALPAAPQGPLAAPQPPPATAMRMRMSVANDAGEVVQFMA